MLLDPQACVVAIKKRFKQRPGNPDRRRIALLSSIKHLAKLQGVKKNGYMLSRYEDLVVVYFVRWRSMLPQVTARLDREANLSYEVMKPDHILWVYPKDTPPSANLRRKLDPARLD